MSDTTETKKNTPAAKVTVGLQTASIWKNESEGRAFYNVTFGRRYRDAKGDWKSTDSYGRDDLLALAKLADLAHTKVLELQNVAGDKTGE
jgi:hypothetical protein